MEQRIFTNFSGKGFTQIKNEAVQDANLSWKARGILVYLASLPSDWTIYKNEVLKHSTDKKDSFNSGWNELKEAGYVKGVLNRKNGRFDGYTWFVSDERKFIEKKFDIPEADFPFSGISENGKSDTTNTNYTNTNNTNIIDTKIDTRELFEKGYQKLFISEKTVNLFLNFGNESDTREYLDIIFRTKKHVEQTASKADFQCKIEGYLWTDEIEKTAFRFILNMKNGIRKNREIKNLKGYWNKVMVTLWENAYVMEKEHGVYALLEQHANGELEIEDYFFDSKNNYSSEKDWRKARKKFVYDI